jgi:hypothetical protein
MRKFVTTVVLAVVACCAASAQAQQFGWDRFWHRTAVDAKRMNHYPEPFIYADREAAREPFRVMVCNGWKLQNTLSSHYFHPESQQLTRAGELKLRSILVDVPEQYRTVYVLRGDNADVTAMRVDAVQQSIARAMPGGAMPQVVETGIELRGHPGDYVDDTYRKAQSSQPAPVLPTAGTGMSN